MKVGNGEARRTQRSTAELSLRSLRLSVSKNPIAPPTHNCQLVCNRLACSQTEVDGRESRTQTMSPGVETSQLKDIVFWRSLCPKLSITPSQPLTSISSFGKDLQLRSDDWSVCKELINEDGYFAYDSWFDNGLVDRLADCFNTLTANKIPCVFAFVYDEFWELLLQLDPMLKDLLGDYEILPAVWSWFVRHDNQTAFTPHRDQVRDVLIEDDDHLDYLTIWIPLTDLDHLSSSICVFPASLDPDYEDSTPEIRIENMQDVRCLQGKRGSVFCWTTQLAHWGTKQSSHGPPRMSVGYFVQASGADPLEDPPLDLSVPMTLEQRLAIIGQQIIDYSREADDDLLRAAAELVG